MTSKKIFAISSLCLACIVIGYRAGQVRASPGTVNMISPTSVEAGGSRSSRDETVLTPPMRVEVPTGLDPARPTEGSIAPDTAETAILSLRNALASKVPAPFSDDRFAAKYEGLGLAELRAALILVEDEFQRERDRIGQEMIDFGRYETQIVAEGQKASGLQATVDDPIVSFGFHMEPGEGFTTVQLARIPQGEYPDFDSLEYEVGWLKTQIAIREQQ